VSASTRTGVVDDVADAGLAYSFDQTPGDAFLLHFSLNNASNVLAVIRDIRLVSPYVPWAVRNE
jgi:hypothetical protein